jgi:hypothetical protein
VKKVDEEKVRAEASRGKNEPMARSPHVAPQQNGEAEPTISAARKQAGTDQARRQS